MPKLSGYPDYREPLIWYEGSSLSNRRHLKANHQGSVVAVASSTGTSIAANTYDEYGIPEPRNQGRFQYTGQIMLPELGMYHYKARIYSPTLGRFLQTDPIGYDDQINLYAYVGNDPVNANDPTGQSEQDIVVTGCRSCHQLYPTPELPPSIRFTSPSVENLKRNLATLALFAVRVHLCINWLQCSISTMERDIDDPDSLEGATEEEVAEAAEAKGYTERPGGSRRGGGKVYEAGNGSDQIRIMPGGGNRTGKDSEIKEGGPYVEIAKHGTLTVKPLAGNRTLKPR